MKTLFLATVLAVAMLFIATPSPASTERIPDLVETHFSLENMIEWDVADQGYLILYYRCSIHPDKYFGTLHDVVDQGFGLEEKDAGKYPYPVLYFQSIQAEGAVYGYVIKKYPHTYLRLVDGEPREVIPRWEFIAIDPSEDGLNDNEIPR